MNEDQKHMSDMMENYLYDCQENGTSDFEVWCEDNIENNEQKNLLYKIKNHVDAIANLLY